MYKENKLHIFHTWR